MGSQSSTQRRPLDASGLGANGGLRARAAHVSAGRIGGRDEVPADRPVFCGRKLGHLHELRTRRQLKRRFELAAVTHSAGDRFAHGVNAIGGGLPIAYRRNNEVEAAVQFVNQMPRHGIVGGVVWAIAVQEAAVLTDLSGQRAAYLEHPLTIGSNRE